MAKKKATRPSTVASTPAVDPLPGMRKELQVILRSLFGFGVSTSVHRESMVSDRGVREAMTAEAEGRRRDIPAILSRDRNRQAQSNVK